MSIVLGIKGREWAWQAKHWDSVEHFKKVQHNWTIASIVVLLIAVILPLVLLVIIVALNPAGVIQEAQ